MTAPGIKKKEKRLVSGQYWQAHDHNGSDPFLDGVFWGLYLNGTAGSPIVGISKAESLGGC